MSRRAVTRVQPRRDEAGAAALEFALVLPILIMMVFAIITYGYMFSVRQALTQAAAEGARAAAVASTGQASTRATAAVNEALSGLSLTCGAGGLTCTPTTSTCGTASCMSVTVAFAYRANNPLPSLLPDALIPASLTFTSSAEVN
ncbi:TadE family protein [Nocardioides sp.]|uniref:TadE/TadG family type IV pilus assembly protein n=1 Tax=Nocardioides sp. TaxID=35761 RepID=UPI002CA112F6|nr:TadE family protein [Nocardioides sp.]HSX67538.1 TadE family protein [Nocardioides sp.]